MTEMKDVWSQLGATPGDIAAVDQLETYYKNLMNSVVDYLVQSYNDHTLLPCSIYTVSAIDVMGLDSDDETSMVVRGLYVGFFAMYQLALARAQGRLL